MAKKELNYDNAFARAANLCVRAEHAPAEINRKLRQWGASAEMAHQVVENLTDSGFIDEKRYAEAFVHDKVCFDYWGRRKIRYTLHCNGIPENLIEDAIAQIDEEEYKENLTALLKNKLRSQTETNPYKLKSGLFRYASSRGFEPDLALPVISQLIVGADDFDYSME